MTGLRPLDRLDADPEARACSLWYVRRALGRLDYGDDRIVAYLQQLVDGFGFPAPLPCAVKGQRGLTRAVTVSSCWIRAAVDAWLDEWTPPGLAAALDARAMAAAASDMDARAASLQLVRG